MVSSCARAFIKNEGRPVCMCVCCSRLYILIIDCDSDNTVHLLWANIEENDIAPTLLFIYQLLESAAGSVVREIIATTAYVHDIGIAESLCERHETGSAYTIAAHVKVT